MPRHACCLCSGHSPQSEGQPSRTSVWKVSGMVPGLLNRADARYACASPYTSASNQPCSRQRLRRYTLLPRMRSEEHTSELQSRGHLVCRLLLEKKKTATSRCKGLIRRCSMLLLHVSFFFFNDTATTEIYTLSLHDALPIDLLPRL